jgi:hypothetical protein
MADYKAVLIKLQQNLNTLREREAKYRGDIPARKQVLLSQEDFLIVPDECGSHHHGGQSAGDSDHPYLRGQP